MAIRGALNFQSCNVRFRISESEIQTHSDVWPFRIVLNRSGRRKRVFCVVREASSLVRLSDSLIIQRMPPRMKFIQ